MWRWRIAVQKTVQKEIVPSRIHPSQILMQKSKIDTHPSPAVSEEACLLLTTVLLLDSVCQPKKSFFYFYFSDLDFIVSFIRI